MILLGIARKPLANFDIANAVIWKSVTVKGIFGRKMFDTWETMLRMLRCDRFDLQNKLDKVLSSKNYLLDEYQDAFGVLANGKEMKLVFTPNGNKK